MTQRVLVVEDEAVLRSSMVRTIAKISGIEVDGAGTLADAIALVESAVPDVVISDLDLPDGSGVELLSYLDGAGTEIPILFVSAYLGALGDQIPSRPGIEVREKPLPMSELRRAVQTKLELSVDEASIPFTLDEYVQLACLGRHSISIEVRGEGGGGGHIMVWEGDLYAANDAQGGGTEAFIRLSALALEAGTTIDCHGIKRVSGQRNLRKGSWQSLLLDSARVHDEAHRDDAPALSPVAPAPSADKPAETDDIFADMLTDDDDAAPVASVAAAPRPTPMGSKGPRPLALVPEPSAGPPEQRAEPPPRPRLVPPARFTELCERGIEALLHKDYPRAMSSFLAAEELQPGDPLVRGNIERLRALGFDENIRAMES